MATKISSLLHPSNTASGGHREMFHHKGKMIDGSTKSLYVERGLD
jgi:hypothetical protein